MAETKGEQPPQNPLKANPVLKGYLAFTCGVPPAMLGEIFQHPDRDAVPGNFLSPPFVVNILSHLPSLQAFGCGLVSYSFLNMAHVLRQQRPQAAVQNMLIDAGFHPEQVGHKKSALRSAGRAAISLATAIGGYKFGEIAPHWLVVAGLAGTSYAFIRYEDYCRRRAKAIE